jgi:putative phosphoesterase
LVVTIRNVFEWRTALQIGIISDIHAGLAELELALQHLNHAQVDQIVCAGDLVDFGKDGDAVVRRVIESGIPCVQGNHDRMARDQQRLRQRKQAQGQSIHLLRPETVELLDQLPPVLRFTWDGIKVMLTHAAPWGGEMYIYPESTTPLLRRVAREGQADVIILGHTHRPMWVEVEIDNCTIINPGSTSQNYELGVGTYGILSLPERIFRIFDTTTGRQLPLDKDHR